MKKANLIRFLVFFACIAGIGAIGIGHHAYAVDPKPGVIIDSNNIDQYKENFPDFMVQLIKDGYGGFDKPATIHVQEKKPIGLNASTVEGARRNAGKVSFDADGMLVNWEWGIPFPDPKEPDLARKVMWNRYYKPIGDDITPKVTRIFTKRSKTGSLITGDQITVQAFFSNRHDLDPKPAYPDNPNNLWRGQLIKSLIPPTTGLATLVWRYNDPTKNDDLWNYIPTLRRTLRMLSSERANPIHGTVVSWDDAQGFDGQMKNFNFKLLGKVKMLAVPHQTSHSTDMPNGIYDFMVPNGPKFPYELIDLYKIEITPKDDPRYPFPVRIVYICPENYNIYYAEVYDKQGSLWKGFVATTEPTPMDEKHPESLLYSNPILSTIDFKTYAYFLVCVDKISYNQGLKPEMFNPGTLVNF